MINTLSSLGFSLFSKYIFSFSKYTKQPKLRMKSINEIYPPPGASLEVPEWDKELFLQRIGGGTSEFADKFENMKQIFSMNPEQMKEQGVPPRMRRYIATQVEMLRRGVLTFEYLQRRTVLEIPVKEVKKVAAGANKAAAKQK